MPQAARVSDQTAHGCPLSPGPGSKDVTIGFLPAWRAVPAAIGAGIQSAKASSDATLKVAESATLTAAAAVPPVALPAAETAETAARAAASAAMGAMIQAAAQGCGADIHNCMTPYVPIPPTPTPPSAMHGPGVVIDGCATVLINNLPAAFVGNTIIEALGPPDKIVMGCPTVMICTPPQGSALQSAAAASAPFCEICAEAAAAKNA